MGKRITIDQLQKEVNKILADYADNSFEAMDKAAEKIGKHAVEELKSASPVGATGRYKKGWTYIKERARLWVKVIIFNKTDGSITHLLEHGHALRQGGRVPPEVHIAPVEKEAVEQFEKGVLKEL